MFTNANAQFAPGQTVIADGRTATVAYIAPNGTIYVATLSGLVPARTVIEATCSGAPRQLQLGSPLPRTAHVSLAPRAPSRTIPLRLRAA